MQQQYKTQYGTIFAVKEHNGAPAIMCRAEHSETWSLSSMIEPYTPGAWTAEELQFYLDNWAATKGWKPVEDSPACLCVNCTCTGCHEECYGHCHGCGHPVDHCNSYQTEGKKDCAKTRRMRHATRNNLPRLGLLLRPRTGVLRSRRRELRPPRRAGRLQTAAGPLQRLHSRAASRPRNLPPLPL